MSISISASCLGSAPSMMVCVAGSDPVVLVSLFVSCEESACGDEGGADARTSIDGWGAGGGGGSLGIGKSLCTI